jgi:prepilin-type N-terminal cleavage/methylation domain-containing protein
MRTPLRSSRLSREGGFTLIEMMVAIALLMAVLAIAMPVLIQALKTEPKISSRAAKIGEARALADRVTRELRQGGVVYTAGASSISFRTYVRRTTCGGTVVSPSNVSATRCRVTYSCSGGVCTRIEQTEAGTGGTPVRMVEGLLSNSVFSYYPSTTKPSYVTVRFALPADNGEDAITVEDGAGLRNAAS